MVDELGGRVVDHSSRPVDRSLSGRRDTSGPNTELDSGGSGRILAEKREGEEEETRQVRAKKSDPIRREVDEEVGNVLLQSILGEGAGLSDGCGDVAEREGTMKRSVSRETSNRRGEESAQTHPSTLHWILSGCQSIV